MSSGLKIRKLEQMKIEAGMATNTKRNWQGEGSIPVCILNFLNLRRTQDHLLHHGPYFAISAFEALNNFPLLQGTAGFYGTCHSLYY